MMMNTVKYCRFMGRRQTQLLTKTNSKEEFFTAAKMRVYVRAKRHPRNGYLLRGANRPQSQCAADCSLPCTHNCDLSQCSLQFAQKKPFASLATLKHRAMPSEAIVKTGSLSSGLKILTSVSQASEQERESVR